MSRLPVYLLLINAMGAMTASAADFNLTPSTFNSSATIPKGCTDQAPNTSPLSSIADETKGTTSLKPVLGTAMLALYIGMASNFDPFAIYPYTDKELKRTQQQADRSKLRKEKRTLHNQYRPQSQQQKHGKFKSNHR